MAAVVLLVSGLAAQVPPAVAQPLPAETVLKIAQQAQAQYEVTYGRPKMTAEYVRRVALASRRPSGGQNGNAARTESSTASIERSVASSPVSAVEQAVALGLPVNFEYLLVRPEVAAQVK